MTNSSFQTKKLARTQIKRAASTGTFVGAITEADAKQFRRANTALVKAVTGSKAKAVQVLRASGFLTASGKRAKRYR